ncbi:MAG: hypothetical protein WBA61_07380 [Aequorivita sp.]
MKKEDFILTLYKDRRSVFRLSDVAMLFPEAAGKNLSGRMGYYVDTGRLLKLRRGIYAKPDYNPLELANMLFTPSYISLEYVLQQAGIVFQYDSRYTSISYLSREVLIDGKTYSYRRIKETIIMDTTGIIRNKKQCNMATPERALLDMLYLNKDFYFDNLNAIDQEAIAQILPIYKSLALEKRVAELFKK